VDFIQIREKDLEDRALFQLTCKAVSLAQNSDCRIIVNGRADIALAAGAHGVHLPSAGLRPGDLRSWLPRRFLIGLSVHSTSEAHYACAQGADYVLLGPVFPTESKLRYGAPLGLDCLKKACLQRAVPVLALGGMRPELIESVVNAGAAGIAGIGLFQSVGRRRSSVPWLSRT